MQRAMQQALADRGITRSFPHGHGLGLEVRDYPILYPDAGDVIRDDCIELAADLALEPDMVVVTGDLVTTGTTFYAGDLFAGDDLRYFRALQRKQLYRRCQDLD